MKKKKEEKDKKKKKDDFLKNKWTPELEKHIFEGNIQLSPRSKFSGFHYNNGRIKRYVSAENYLDSRMSGLTFKEGDIMMIGKVSKGNGFYEGGVAYFSEKVYKDQIAQVGQKAPKGFVRKKDRTTMFPDSWSKDKIKNEVAEAYSNYETKLLEGREVYCGKMSDGTLIEFQFNVDGSINSAYPNFQPEIVSLYN